MNTNEINNQAHMLESLINNALINSIKVIMPKASNLQEPDYVASLAVNFTKDLYEILRFAFSGHEFAVSGVFCHQRPKVDINLSKKPELGDILFVYSDDDGAGEKRYNSLLLQAKISRSGVHTVGKSEAHQLELYEKWPKFRYYQGILNGIERDIYPKSITDGAQYLLIDDNPYTNGVLGCCNRFPMGCAIPGKTLQLNRPFSTELIEFLKFKAGRVFDGETDLGNYATGDDWSKMIWDLLKSSCGCCSRRKNIRLDRFPRLNGCVRFGTSGGQPGMLDKVMKYSEYVKDDVIEEEPEPGMSVVVIESRRIKEE